MIDRATVQKIKDTADIVEVVSDYVHLVRRGANYMGLCPFHNERTPSFSVNKARNFCYCFSCHKGGSPVNFIMEKEGISYHDALLQLAKKYGIKVEEKELTDEEREAMSRKEGMYVANEWVMKWFEENLTETSDGRNIGLQYLYGRGVTEEAIRAFHLGYSPDRGSALVEASRKKGFNPEVMKSLGLIGTSQTGHDYDRFRGRVIFPVLNSSGKVVAFGGRDLKGGPAKYINSPETELYKKSYELYGLFQARQAIVRDNRCYLVEGYLDVIGMWQSGMKNVVASSGTALTDGQIALIHRFTNNVTLIYDGDAAGIKASLRGIDMLLLHDLNVNVLLLPDGDDPDSFARKHTPEQFREYVSKNETDIIRFKTQVLMNEVNNNPQKRFEATQSVVQSLACISDRVKRDIYIQECSRLLNLSEDLLAKSTAEERIKVKQRLVVNREQTQLTNDIDTGRIEPTAPVSGYLAPGTVKQTQDSQPIKIQDKHNPLRPLEKDVLEYCIKYGFMPFCEAENDSGNVFTINVLEYVDEELAADNIVFSEYEYGKVFSVLKDLLPQFNIQLVQFHKQLENEISEMRRNGIDEIANGGYSMERIRKEEEILETKIKDYYSIKEKDFCRDYPSRILASHEDNVIRQITIEAINEPYQLSNIYSREHPVEKEEDKLQTLVPIALTVWKNGILDLRFHDLLEQFKAIAGKGFGEEERNLQAKLAEVIRLRSEVAKNIGDRILSPK